MNMNSNLEEELREACCLGSTDTVHKLINDGIDVNSQNKMNGWTSLHWAAKRGHTSIVSTLLENNADVSIKDFKGDIASDVALNKSTQDILQNWSNVAKDNLNREVNISSEHIQKDKDEMQMNYTTDDSKINFTPKYLLHPVFPHIQENSRENTDQYIDSLQHKNSSNYGETYKVGIPSNELELVLKVRLVNCNDFIEVELDTCEVTFDNLLKVCCEELEVKREEVQKVRKLPNTILRKDKDVKRLKEFQELELVLYVDEN